MSDTTQEQIERLKEEILSLKEAIQYLAFSKTTDPKFAFFDWIIKNDVFGEKRARLDRVLLILGDRLVGEPLLSKKVIPGVSNELLYSSSPPTHEQAVQLLMEALGVDAKTIVVELFDALRQQGIHKEITALKSG